MQGGSSRETRSEDQSTGRPLQHCVSQASGPDGGHDLDTLQGDVYLKFAEGWEPFTPMGGGETIVVPKGELVYTGMIAKC